MSKSTTRQPQRPKVSLGEHSFSLIETILSMSILATVVLQIGGAQGNLAYLATYSRNMVKATWYAKRIMSNIDFQASYLPFKSMNTTLKKNIPIKSGKETTEFTYDLEIVEWKFPILDALFQDKGGGQAGAPNAEVVANAVKQILGDHRLKIARVEVFWPEGAKRNSITVAQLLTNQKSLNQHLVALAPTYKDLLNKVAGIDEKKPTTEKECIAAKGQWNKATKKCEKLPGSQGSNPGGQNSQGSGGNNAPP